MIMITVRFGMIMIYDYDYGTVWYDMMISCCCREKCCNELGEFSTVPFSWPVSNVSTAASWLS